MTASFIYDAVRTPFGRAGGALSGIRPDDLAALVMRASVERAGIDPAIASSVVLTTITDVVGFFVFLGLGAWLLF